MNCATTVPPEAAKVLSVVREQLAESLVAFYLHGSATAGGLRPDSDVDLLAVIDRPMTSAVRASLLNKLLKLSGRPGQKSAARPIELIIFLRADLSVEAYPARCEFIYGEWLRDEFEAGKEPAPARDPEMTLVLAQARREAKTLAGPAADELLPVISQEDIRRAIADVLPPLLKTLGTDGRNVLLTLARMWRTLATGEFAAKDVAAKWAESRLPPEQALTLAIAREAYLGARKDNWRRMQKELERAANSLSAQVKVSLQPSLRRCDELNSL